MNKNSVVNIKIVIQPIYIQLLHKEVFMGPCRYGKGNDLTYEGETKVAYLSLLIRSTASTVFS